MSVEKPENTRLAVQYEALRRQQYELISSLLDVLPHIDGLPESRIAEARDALFHADHPFLLVFVGPFSAGKSSLINALVGQPDLLPIGPTPTTDSIVMLRHGDQAQRLRGGDTETVFSPSALLHKVSFVDTPGLESIFQTHEAMTRQFLHRADAVLLVMLATQAMTARNLDYLRTLKAYGKTVIIVVNQVDLLTDDDAASVRQYVMDQSNDLLGYRPLVWMVSARRGLEARLPDGSVDAALWQASGLEQVERYLDEQLNDAARLRQKLHTSLQIVRNVHDAAQDVLRGNQSAIDQYQSIARNVESQLDAYRQEQERTVHEYIDGATRKFTEAGERGQAALRTIFRPNRVLPLLGGGFSEMIGFSGLARRARRTTLYVRPVFNETSVYQPIEELPDGVGKLAPRLEGRDVQDTEALITYARREIDGLPAAIRDKVIGALDVPQRYDRSALQTVDAELEAIEKTAGVPEMERTETDIRNTLMYTATWLALTVILLIFVWRAYIVTADGESLEPMLFTVVLLLGALGIGFLFWRGRSIADDFARRMTAHGERYGAALKRAADKQITYGMQMRRDAVAPLVRLVTTQTETQKTSMTRLQAAQQQIATIERDLTRLTTP